MTLAREVADEILQRVAGREKVTRRVVRPTVTRDDVEKVYVHRARPVVHRVRRIQRIIPVVQPLEDAEVYHHPPASRQRVAPVERRETLHDWAPETVRALRLAESEVAELTSGRVLETHLQEDAHPDEVHEVVVRETVEDVTPLRRRRVRAPTVIEEVKPVYETITETEGVDTVQWRKPINWSDWVEADDEPQGTGLIAPPGTEDPEPL